MWTVKLIRTLAKIILAVQKGFYLFIFLKDLHSASEPLFYYVARNDLELLTFLLPSPSEPLHLAKKGRFNTEDFHMGSVPPSPIIVGIGKDQQEP